MRALTLLVATAALLAGSAGAISAPAEPQNRGSVLCPPDVKSEDPPTVGRGGSKSLSDDLADSKGVICPPSGLDQDMQVTPPGGGHLKVVPPPGSPGGDQSVQPKT